ncbi:MULTISPECIES: ShlB/FhaC/HecB family hemolysin secretion/activation protein [Ramlibacter]|uniref:ShlB/FhaC/HecB family hemolysin secretion/activation protein n=1 Tax=Ramlibacter aquaticus TaxID=2780094 RepID=A0ABR9SCJ6_9BURK|nr:MULTISPECIES: ShlB/FhaC/HecB family hemolysin secretion/activation protein [Ramlibacter]MBE7940074.1 ShlB/FhaC/HecB family hemolysin secretion/activation protein [Ramlibacter aquaticus]
MNRNILATSLALALAAWAVPAQAQQAGLQGATPPQAPQDKASVLPTLPGTATPAPAPGGATVTLRQVVIEGNRALDTDTLLSKLGKVQGQALDMAGLEALAARVTAAYRAAGYPFAQAWLAPQDLKDGVLRIQVQEGRWGTVRAQTLPGKPGDAAGAQPFLDAGLQRGDAIRNAPLERTLLILDDQPGMKIRPVIRPGAAQGEADLDVYTERVSHVSGEAGLDNTGPRSTGEYRVHGMVAINSPFSYGDKVTLNGMVTNESLWLGSADYEWPLDASGWRGHAGLAHTSYQLAAQFSALDAVGVADVLTLGVSYPLVRSQAANLLLSAGLTAKKLRDDYRAVSTTVDKRSQALPLALQFDRRDTLLGGGVSYGSLTLTLGHLHLDDAAAAADAAGAKTAGSFSRLNLDVARIQALPAGFSAYGRFSGQWASKNLDASEKFNLGGFYGVRAYPLGEGTGDQGWLGQLELRHALGAFTPFLFVDAGHATTNARPWGSSAAAGRSVGAAGAGARYLQGVWTAEATLATRTHGGTATSDSRDRNPRLFFTLARRF